jgi:uncharacterized protein
VKDLRIVLSELRPQILRNAQNDTIFAALPDSNGPYIKMAEILDVVVSIDQVNDHEVLVQKVAHELRLTPEKIQHVQVLKRSIDARSRTPIYRLRVEVFQVPETYSPEPVITETFRSVESAKSVIIIGAGPAGYFAALQCIELGIKPIVLDRGKDVRARRRDLRAIQQFGVVDPHSNYCFGEGGAGTYSDGKLYTRSQKRGNIQKALLLLVEHGATSDILVDAHPHIGSNKLPDVISRMRDTIEQFGGEVHFGQYVTDFVVQDGKMRAVITNQGAQEWPTDAVILATGHSARDMYHLLHKKNILVEPKPFALGVRVEHAQSFIDQVQYRQEKRSENLPAASYSLVTQVADRGVFSFCMCPGGLVVPAATSPGEIVVNGMSMSRRDSPYANSGVVTSIEASDVQAWTKHGAMQMLAFQQEVEQKLFQAGDGSQKAPALRLTDFVEGRISSSLNGTSYIPGLFAAPLYDLMPRFVVKRLQEGLRQFGKQMNGYYTKEANVIGTESRSSSPVRIPRDTETCMHPQVSGLFPCGEGAGYAGGIISAALDGQNVAKAVGRFFE